MVAYTKNFHLIKSDFDSNTWHDNEYNNLDIIDSVVGGLIITQNFRGKWTNNISYLVNDMVADIVTSQIYTVKVDHTTPATGTFDEYFLANPGFYELWNGYSLTKDWAIKSDGVVYDGTTTDYSSKAWASSVGLIPSGSAYEQVLAAAAQVGLAADQVALAAAQATTAIEQATAAGASAGQAAGHAYTAYTDSVSASRSAQLAEAWATQLTTPVEGGEYSAKQYAYNAWGSENAAAGSANAASGSVTLAQEWATKMDGQVASTDCSSKYYAGQSATSAQDAQDALDAVNGLIATPIGTIFQSIYVDESIDIARALNGQLILSTKFTGFRAWLNTVQTATPNLFTTEVNWQSEKALSKFGQCGKFVIDDDTGTIRLPAVVNAQGLLSLSSIGNLVSESLPNITGGFNGGVNNFDTVYIESGAFRANGNSWGGNAGGGTATQGMKSFDASRSSSTYQDDAPVQQEAIQYPYYIQVATGVEETLPAIREYEINNPFFFGQSMYSDVAPYNASWLESNGQYNASSVYPDFWTQLTGVELNGSLNVGDTIEISGKTYVKRGLPVELSTDAYTDYDFVVNTSDSTFRLPLLNGEEDWVGNTSQTLSTADIVSGTPFTWTATKNGFIEFTCYSENNTQIVVGLINGVVIFHGGEVTQSTTPRPGFWLKVKKGDVVSIAAESQTLANVGISFIPAVGNGALYYYVGDTVQDASLINAGAVLGQLANKADTDLSNCTKPYVTETYHNGTEWYRVWSDGWVEQGGQIIGTTSGTLTYLKPYQDTNYTIFMHPVGTYAGTVTGNGIFNPKTRTASSCTYHHDANVNVSMWQACGQGV